MKHLNKTYSKKAGARILYSKKPGARILLK